MKKILFALFLVLVIAASAVAYWYVALRETQPDSPETPVQTVEEPAVEVTPQPEPEPAPVVEEPAPEPVVEEPAPEPAVEEPAPEPEPAPLPALSAEAEALLPKAESGDPVAQFNLARLYVLGEGMAINREEFLRWCRTAAEQGLPEAQFTLGMCYRQGLGVAADEQEASRLLQLAADAGFAPAAEQLK